MSLNLHDLTGYVLRRASSEANAEFSALLAPLDLRPGEATLLLLIEDRPGLTQADAGRLLEVQRANMAPLCARLESRGLVDRVEVDGRSHGLLLSAGGSAMVERIKAAIAAHEAMLKARVPGHLQPHVLPVLRALWGRGED